MANIKSAKKRVLIAQRNTERNVAFKTSIKTAVKKVLACAASEDRAIRFSKGAKRAPSANGWQLLRSECFLSIGCNCVRQFL